MYGQKGDQGVPGLDGHRGIKGDMGFPGLPGIKGNINIVYFYSVKYGLLTIIERCK